MDGHLRTAKTGNHWSQAELRAYTIVVEFQDAVTFFSVDPLPRPGVSDEVLNNVAANDTADRDNHTLLRYMDLTMDPSVPSPESSVVDFSAHLLNLLGYSPVPRVVCRRVDIPLTICGETCHAKTNVCIVDLDKTIVYCSSFRGTNDTRTQSHSWWPRRLPPFKQSATGKHTFLARILLFAR